ncbi:YHS domain-containing protein [Kamptonema cortianum]|nr:YHS domain-containing protein [Geitlerinema splendidum]MDK3158716.1 YHS domain-containing protein [Kamptonema cortianum]
MNYKLITLSAFAFSASFALAAPDEVRGFDAAPSVAQDVQKFAQVHCPVLGNAVDESSQTIEFKGLFVRFCCPGCDVKFLAEPDTYFDKASEENKAIAESMFDPVARVRVGREDTKASTVFGGVLYLFQSKENLAKFQEFPGTYVEIPDRESLKCPIMGTVMESHSLAVGYADHKGVRYYFCCDGCDEKFLADPDKAAASVVSAVKDASTGKAAPQGQTLAPT